MKKYMKRFLSTWVLFAAMLISILTGCTQQTENPDSISTTNGIIQSERAESIQGQESASETRQSERTESTQGQETALKEDGSYSSKQEVALYIHTYGHLPDNYITKKEAEELGWDSKEGNLWDVAPGKSIGGSHYGNYEGSLPSAKGRSYKECDIDYNGGYRGAKRIIFSNDGLIFYTEDHYKNFEQLY